MEQQLKGGFHDSVNFKNCKSLEESQLLFNQMKKVFLDINRWDQLFKKNTEFYLKNTSGQEQSAPIQIGDLVAIKIPGPKNHLGDGFDWVKVQNMIIAEKEDQSILSFELQPCANPKKPNQIAHFFQDSARNNFIIKKEGCTITAEVHGRNEIPNCSNVPFRDQLRNFFIANGGIFGMSKIQWEVWSKNILDEKYLEKCLHQQKQTLK